MAKLAPGPLLPQEHVPVQLQRPKGSPFDRMRQALGFATTTLEILNLTHSQVKVLVQHPQGRQDQILDPYETKVFQVKRTGLGKPHGSLVAEFTSGCKVSLDFGIVAADVIDTVTLVSEQLVLYNGKQRGEVEITAGNVPDWASELGCLPPKLKTTGSRPPALVMECSVSAPAIPVLHSKPRSRSSDRFVQALGFATTTLHVHNQTDDTVKVLVKSPVKEECDLLNPQQKREFQVKRTGPGKPSGTLTAEFTSGCKISLDFGIVAADVIDTVNIVSEEVILYNDRQRGEVETAGGIGASWGWTSPLENSEVDFQKELGEVGNLYDNDAALREWILVDKATHPLSLRANGPGQGEDARADLDEPTAANSYLKPTARSLSVESLF